MFQQNGGEMKSLQDVDYFGREKDLKVMKCQQQKDIPKHNSDEDNTSNIDSSFEYLITFAGFINTLLSMSIQNSIGIYYTYIIGEFDIGLTTAAVIGSTNTAIYLGGGVFAVRIVECFGERPALIFGGFLQFIGCISSSFAPSFSLLFAFLSIVNGIGVALSYVTILLSVNKYSYKNRSLSMTLTSLGGSVTSVVFPLIVRTLLQTYGFRGAMLIHSAILLNTVICGAVVFPVISKGLREDTTNVDENKEPLDMSFCKNPKFLAYLVTNFTLSIGYYIPPGLLPNTALSTGVSLDDISLAFSIGGIASILGRILFGFIAHRHPNQTTKLFCFFIIAMGLPMGIIPFSSTFIHYLVFSLINGFFLGGVNLGYNLTLKNILLPKYYGRGIGFGLLMQSLASLVGNPFAGLPGAPQNLFPNYLKSDSAAMKVSLHSFMDTSYSRAGMDSVKSIQDFLIQSFLQDNFGDGGIPFYLGMSILVLSGLVLLPFSSAIKDETATEINFIVPSNRVTKRIKYNYSMNDISDPVVSYF